ncbi:MAG: hypothetical protein V4628_01155 [Pseudomonadota bacterium]
MNLSNAAFKSVTKFVTRFMTGLQPEHFAYFALGPFFTQDHSQW